MTQVSLVEVQAEIAQARATLAKLQQIACVNLARHAADINNFQPMNDTMLGADLYKLAVETTLRPLILRAALLDVFCEADASAILLKLPNQLWFWHVLNLAAEKAMKAFPGRITAEDVSASMSEALIAQFGQRKIA